MDKEVAAVRLTFVGDDERMDEEVAAVGSTRVRCVVAAVVAIVVLEATVE